MSKTSKLRDIGFLICLMSLYMISDVFKKTPIAVFGILLFPVGFIIIISSFILDNN